MRGGMNRRFVHPLAKSVPAVWNLEIEAWARWLAVSASASTVRTRRDTVRRLARAFPDVSPWDMNEELLAGWFAEAGRSWSREYRRSVLASVRGFYSWAVDAHRLDSSPAEGLPRVRSGPAVPRPIGDAELVTVLTDADDRVRLILRLAAEAGLRRGEIARIHRRDVTSDRLGPVLVVHGKGDRSRRVPLPVSLARALHHRWQLLSGGFLFPGETFGHLSAEHVGRIATAALPDGWGLHTLRHRFATRAYAASGDLLAVQQLLGHSSAATTQRYIALEPTVAAWVVSRIEVGAVCSSPDSDV